MSLTLRIFGIITGIAFCTTPGSTTSYTKSTISILPRLLHLQVCLPLTVEYAHPVETMLLGIGFFLPVLFLTNHLLFLWTWLAVREIQTYEVHSGYDFPWSPTKVALSLTRKLIPFYGGPRFHDYHHEQFNANYASSFTYLGLCLAVT